MLVYSYSFLSHINGLVQLGFPRRPQGLWLLQGGVNKQPTKADSNYQRGPSYGFVWIN